LQLKQAGTNTGSSRVIFGDADTASPGQIIYDHSNSSLQAVVNGTERARIDSSGRLLVGTSTSRTNGGQTPQLQLESTTANGSSFSLTQNQADANSSILLFGKTRSTTVGGSDIVAANDRLGSIRFSGGDGTDLTSIGASIEVFVDGTPGANDMPGRLVFSTTADGASSPTERMRIKNDGTINFSNVAVYADNAAAKTGGLVDGDVYRTSTGDLKIVYT